jgi:fibronectin-binding autotransporter adhesin
MNTNKFWLTVLFWVIPMLAGSAETYTWSGAAGNGLYQDAANWMDGEVPANAPDTIVMYGETGAGVVLVPPGTGTVGGIFFTDHSGKYEFRCQTEGSTLVVNVMGSADGEAFRVATGGDVVFGPSVKFNFQGDHFIEVAESGSLAIHGLMQGTGPAASGRVMTKTGMGALQIDGATDGISGIRVAQGTVVVGASASIGSACSVTLKGGGLALAGGLTFANNIEVGDEIAPISVHGGGTAVLSGELVLTQNTMLDSHLGTRDGVIQITGPVRETDYARLTIFGPTPVVLSGANTYSGGTHVAEESALYFGAAQAVPASGEITAEPSAYVGATYVANLQASLIARLSAGEFQGTLGFDTNGAAISEGIDLSQLSAYQGIGSKSSAIISGPITVAAGSPYLFGNGNGALYIKSNLAGAGAAGVRVQSAFGSPLTVYLQGDNTFAGDVTAQYANIILDSPNALPGGESGGGLAVPGSADEDAQGPVVAPDAAKVQFEGAAYVGHTERFSSSFSEFLARIGAISDPNAIVGIDASDAAPGRVITENIDLSAGFTRTDRYYLGTSSDVTIDGLITPPGIEGHAGPLYLTAIRGGKLTVNSLIGGAAVDSLVIGQIEPHDSSAGMVRITNSQNDYAGGTYVLGGVLGVGGSNALGSGVVAVGAGATLHVLPDIALANAMLFEPGSTLSGGAELASLVTAGPGVTLDPGGFGATGTLHFHDGLILEGGSRINFDLRDSAQFEQLCVWNGFQVVGNVSDPVIIKLYSLGGSGPGAYAGFDPTQSYSWRFAYIDQQIKGFDPSQFFIDDTEFTLWNNTGGGTFGIEMTADGQGLNITFTPVPEPGTYALMGIGIAMLAAFETRRRRKS